jgi:hypothetical protein
VTDVSEPAEATYADFLASKATTFLAAGFEPGELPGALFDFQAAIVTWALRLGRAAIFAGTGLGKTLMQLSWAQAVVEHTGGNVLILAPLAVAQQTAREGGRFGIPVTVCREREDVRPGINITNYDRFERFDLDDFVGLVLDESSILKSQSGVMRTAIIEGAQTMRFRLACTATPAPNDFMELGNHAEFLGAMTRSEMLSMFFVNDQDTTQKWRLKGHAQDAFWKWICSWAVMIDSPADLGFDGSRFVLPPLRMHEHIVESGEAPEGMLLAVEAQTLLERRNARRSSMGSRVEACAAIVNANPNDSWLIWCDLNAEGDALAASIDGAVQVAGADTPEHKTRSMIDFADGKIRVLVSKASICGFGMNFQVCHNVAFVGLSDSFEQFYQAVRRCWRFGQTQPVECHVITSSAEGAVVANIKRKESDAAKMRAGMLRHVGVQASAAHTSTVGYLPTIEMEIPKWLLAA